MSQSLAAGAPARRFGWYRGWSMVGLCLLAQMMGLGLATNCFTLFLDTWSREFHAPISSIALAMTVFSISCAPFCAAAGWAADKFSVRWMFALGLLLIAAAQVAVGFVHAVQPLIALYVVLAVGVTFSTSIPAQALVARWFVQRRGLALGISMFGITAAGMVFPPIVLAMTGAVGWRMTWFIFSGVIALVVVPLLLLTVRDRPDPESAASPYLKGAGEAAATGPTLTTREILSRPAFWIIGLSFLTAFMVFMGVTVNLKPLVMSHGLTAWDAGLLISAIAVVDLMGKVVSGLVVDRLGPRAPLAAVCLIAALAAAWLGLAQGAPAVVAGFLALGLVSAIWTPMAAAVAIEFGQNNFGRAFGIINVFATFPTVAAPVLAWTREQTGSYSAGLLGLAVLAFLGALLALALKPPKAPLTAA
ncbi:MAG: MFS transporter [Caulobacteraceae bacterium]|nr:MFS transporter [Caulobacteraceae bacterium]